MRIRASGLSSGIVSKFSVTSSAARKAEPIGSSSDRICAGTNNTASSRAVSLQPFGHANISPGGWKTTFTVASGFAGRFKNLPNISAPPNPCHWVGSNDRRCGGGLWVRIEILTHNPPRRAAYGSLGREVDEVVFELLLLLELHALQLLDVG